jgi:hypothetical protein
VRAGSLTDVPNPGLICVVCGHTFEWHELSVKSESVQRVYARDHIQCLYDDVMMRSSCACPGFQPGDAVAEKRTDMADTAPQSLCASCLHPWSVHNWRGSRYGDWDRDRPGCRFEFAKTEAYYPASPKTCVCLSFWPSGEFAVPLE